MGKNNQSIQLLRKTLSSDDTTQSLQGIGLLPGQPLFDKGRNYLYVGRNTSSNTNADNIGEPVSTNRLTTLTGQTLSLTYDPNGAEYTLQPSISESTLSINANVYPKQASNSLGDADDRWSVVYAMRINANQEIRVGNSFFSNTQANFPKLYANNIGDNVDGDRVSHIYAEEVATKKLQAPNGLSLQLSNTLLPEGSDINLGSSSNKFSRVYATSMHASVFHGDIGTIASQTSHAYIVTGNITNGNITNGNITTLRTVKSDAALVQGTNLLDVGACLTYLLKKNSTTLTSDGVNVVVCREGNIAWIESVEDTEVFGNRFITIEIPEEYKPNKETTLVYYNYGDTGRIILGVDGELYFPAYANNIYGCWEIEDTVLS